VAELTYAHDAHCNTIHEAGPESCPPARDLVEVAQAAEAAVLRTGDTLIVRVEAAHTTRQAFEEYADHLKVLLPDVKVVLIAADQILVYRSGGSDD
jgi:hypothetical protein